MTEENIVRIEVLFCCDLLRGLFLLRRLSVCLLQLRDVSIKCGEWPDLRVVHNTLLHQGEVWNVVGTPSNPLFAGA